MLVVENTSHMKYLKIQTMGLPSPSKIDKLCLYNHLNPSSLSRVIAQIYFVPILARISSVDSLSENGNNNNYQIHHCEPIQPEAR